MTPRRLLAHLGSLRATLAWLALLALVVLAGRVVQAGWAYALGAVLAALALNLLAALAVHPALRRQLPLLVAHLALLALVALAGLSRLVSLDGRFELSDGVEFDGTLLDARRGAWHHDALQALRFRHDGFEIDYAAGRKRGATRNPVAWVDAQGRLQRAVIGDHRPLRIAGYRVYTSPNKGFAPLLRWVPERGEPQRGTVHLPSYPAHELRQHREWPLPDGRTAWVQLEIDEALIDPAGPARWRLPQRHHLVLRVDAVRAELRPGDALALPGGTLVYEGLHSWMGYRVHHDPTLPWLLAAALLAALALGLHYTLKFAPRRPAAAAALARPGHA
ncbi:MAG: cytochrome c biogenesis protein ResB [Piscinibacter sp.]|uniref:cytochrome c biogenesis protein ResB n=1 Tax=Piscinibacter sp. TaxID=1903157 RepID=UPI00259124D3|nr:cytochrome c biogenesis protein ResB [Piscinibacter sp.]MCW5666191.1 cytochrome c biogenesis protein ResB [Piscinibacter sp.]